MDSLSAAAASAAAQAAEAAGAALTTGSSSSSLLVFVFPFLFPPSLFLLLLLTFFVFFAASVLLRYLKILHLRRQQELLRLAASSAAAGVQPPGAAPAVYLSGISALCAPAAPSAGRWISFEHLALLALLTKDAAWNVLRKLGLAAYAILFFCLSGEERGLETALKRQRVSLDTADAIERRTIIFIRHGESVWNATFNRPMLSFFFPLRFCLFWLWELFLAPERDSVLFDSPLSTVGICQAAELRTALRGSAPSCVPPSSSPSLRGLSKGGSEVGWPALLTAWTASGAGGAFAGAPQSSVEMETLGDSAEGARDGSVGDPCRAGMAVTSGKVERRFVGVAAKKTAAGWNEDADDGQAERALTASDGVRTRQGQCGAPAATSLSLAKAEEREEGMRSRARSVEDACCATAAGLGEGRDGAEDSVLGESTDTKRAAATIESAGLQTANAIQDSLVLVTSNLRRAISTLLIALGPSVQVHSQTVQILSSLQESTRFPDALSLSSFSFSRKSSPPLSQLEEAIVGASLGQLYASHLDQKFNRGNKRIYTTLVGRLFAFSAWLFAEGSTERQAVVVVGHSRWLRYFFRMFLPADQTHPAAEKKLSNCGVLKFDFLQLRQKGSARTDYLIDSRSCQLLRGAFAS
ncbi:phosphoglycerate mutase family protein [Besnoitia besnoiti]|uniref:Phosphoglycerate mutase family protein n=1 Tax=Besnoitia besnoiti TaxID=94643 RepID=A0A2A9MDF2_BESBE|nr:phosphoglycerate mutase family protein [Besnoitia besnoiti]PFH33637.1 phosphoglycerate mutase family protein [Besnoitia besnoiti]